MNTLKIALLTALMSPLAMAEGIKINCDKANIQSLETQAESLRQSLVTHEDSLKASDSSFNQVLSDSASTLAERLKKSQINSLDVQSSVRNLETSIAGFNADKSAEQRTALINQFNAALATITKNGEQVLKDLAPSDAESRLLNQASQDWFQRWSDRNTMFVRFMKASGELAGQQLACELKDRLFKK